SILNILEIHNAIQGEQRKVTDFFDTGNNRKRKHYQEVSDKREILEVQSSDDDEVIFLGTANTATSMSNKVSTTIESEEVFHDSTMESIRLVHIRNPWGHKEFKGAWSVHSAKWTSAL
ncbi:MAG: C2 family cysteine protease, partial [bacterium]